MLIIAPYIIGAIVTAALLSIVLHSAEKDDIWEYIGGIVACAFLWPALLLWLAWENIAFYFENQDSSTSESDSEEDL